MAVARLDMNLDQTFVQLAAQGSGDVHDANGTGKRASLAESFVARRPSVAERLAAGKKLREKVPRASHADLPENPARADPIEILEMQNRTRVQKLIPVRYARMLASPFAFLRGSAAVMTADLATTPVTGLGVAACGDMHVSNFGVYASAERNLVFAINDFDEVHPGPWEWDLKRLAASAAVAVRFQGGNKAACEEAAQRAVRSYRKRMRRYAEMGFLEVWYDRIDERAVMDALSPKTQREARKVLQKAKAKGHVTVLEKLTERVDGHPQIVEDIPLIVRETHTERGMPMSEALDTMLRSYVASLPLDRRRLLARYRIVDWARKVVGVGSVGTGCWVILLEGVDDDDPLFLQVKQALASVLAPHVDFRPAFANQGERVVTGQRLIQGSPDIFLGWGAADDTFFYVRQLADMKGSASFSEGDDRDLAGFTDYCALCGWGLALAHAKSGDPAMIAGYCGASDALDEAIGKFALAYMTDTERDHEALQKAAREGRIPVAGDEVLR